MTRQPGCAEERQHLGADARRRRRGGRRPLGLAVDAQQVGLLPGQPHDRIVVAEAHAQVAIRDAAVERDRLAAAWSKLALEPGEHGVQHERASSLDKLVQCDPGPTVPERTDRVKTGVIQRSRAATTSAPAASGASRRTRAAARTARRARRRSAWRPSPAASPARRPRARSWRRTPRARRPAGCSPRR